MPVGCGFPDPPDPDEEEEDTGGGAGDKRGPEERDSARESRDSLDTLDVSELFTLFSIVSHSFLGDNKPESREKELVTGELKSYQVLFLSQKLAFFGPFICFIFSVTRRSRSDESH